MSAAETTPVVATEPATTAAPVSEPTTTAPVAAESTPAVTSESTATATKPTEEPVGKDEVKIEAVPVSEGTLTYKTGGLLKSLLTSKKHFWLGSEPVAHDSLSKYLGEEKEKTVAHHNVAHASQTGEGLLFFSKRAEDKSHPEGIINLADATEVTREPADRFSFKVHGKKHEFFAPSRAEVDGWVVAIENAIQKAVANKDTVVGGENYKNTHSKLGGAAVGAAAGAAGVAATKDGVHDGSAASEATATADKKENRSSSKGRSQSRKRASIFGGLIGKKDEKSIERANEKEAKKEAKEEEKHEKAAEKEAKKEEKAEEKAAKAEQDAQFHENRKAEEVAAAAVAAPTVGEEGKAAEPASTGLPTAITEGTAPVVADTASPTTKQNKRASIFGFLNKKSGEVPTTKEASKETPAVPAKDAAVTSSTAPQLDPVDTSIPAETAVATETPAAATTETTATESNNPLSAVENTPEAKAANKQKEGGDLFSFMKKKKAEVDEKKAVDSTEGVAAAEKTEGTATSPNTEKRRSSFFNSLGGKKERGVSPEGDKKSGLGGLFRKSSKSVKPTTGPVTDSSAPPAIPAGAETAAATEPVATSTEAAPATEAVAKSEIPAAAEAIPATETAAETTTAAPTATTTV